MKKFLKVIVGILCFILFAEICAIGLFFTVGNGRLTRNMDLGNKYLLDMKYDDAIKAFSAAILTDPMSADAYIGRGDAYLATEDNEKAWADFEKAQELSGDNTILEKKFGKSEILISDNADAPLPGARIEMTGSGHSYSLETDDEGKVSEVLFPGEYSIVVSRDSYLDASEDVNISAGRVDAFSIKMEPEIIPVDYNEIYLDYARQLQNASDIQLFMNIFDSDEPILLITDDFHHELATMCDVYQYSASEEKIVYIGKFQSTGLSDPFVWQGNSIQWASHHNAYSLRAYDGTGTVDAVYGAYIESSSNTPIKEQWIVKNNERDIILSEEISSAQADQLYSEYYMNGEILFFDPIQ